MFLNPIMLAGIAGAAVPLVLHLLSRARCRTMDWGAMMFLEAGESRQHQSARVKQIVLLAMRMAMIALLSLALARPVVRGNWFGGAGTGGSGAGVRGGAGEARVATALRSATSMLDGPEARGSGNRQIFVVCDRQARSWRDVTDAKTRMLRGTASRIAVLPVGGMTVENVAVES